MTPSHEAHARTVKVIMTFLAFVIVCLLTVFIVWAVLRPAHAIDNGQWGHDPGTSQWFKSLRSPQGFPCCDYADGTRIEDPDYRENDDGSYEVFARATWTHVDKEKVVTGTNKVGYAILWWSNAAPLPYCFLPGARG